MGCVCWIVFVGATGEVVFALLVPVFAGGFRLLVLALAGRTVVGLGFGWWVPFVGFSFGRSAAFLGFGFGWWVPFVGFGSGRSLHCWFGFWLVGSVCWFWLWPVGS